MSGAATLPPSRRERRSRRPHGASATACSSGRRRDKVATARTADDNLETVLFHLVRGSGAKGVSGIPPVRGAVIRPLLFAERREIEAFLRENGQDYVTDSSTSATITRETVCGTACCPCCAALTSRPHRRRSGSASSCGRMGPASAGRRNAVCEVHFVRTAPI
ncbi:MAG: ATP-binding protein [Butyricicoccaceae bacterium]